MENQTTESTPGGASENTVSAEVVNIDHGGVQNLNATSVTLRQGGVQNATAEKMLIRQGGVVKVKAENFEMVQGGAVLVQTSQASLTAANAVAVVAGAGVNLDQSAARVIVAGGEMNLDQSAALVMVGNTIKPKNSSIVFLVARNVEGNVSTTFGPQESIIFGAAAGLVAGVVMLIASLFKRRKK